MIAKDKQLHALAGAVAGLSAIFIGWWSLVLVSLLGIGKEIYDAQGNGTPDKFDAVATIVGGACVAVLVELVK